MHDDGNGDDDGDDDDDDDVYDKELLIISICTRGLKN
jgi:hypothetical protein